MVLRIPFRRATGGGREGVTRRHRLSLQRPVPVAALPRAPAHGIKIDHTVEAVGRRQRREMGNQPVAAAACSSAMARSRQKRLTGRSGRPGRPGSTTTSATGAAPVRAATVDETSVTGGRTDMITVATAPTALTSASSLIQRDILNDAESCANAENILSMIHVVRPKNTHLGYTPEQKEFQNPALQWSNPDISWTKITIRIVLDHRLSFTRNAWARNFRMTNKAKEKDLGDDKDQRRTSQNEALDAGDSGETFPASKRPDGRDQNMVQKPA
ncbi:MAG: hypothetical protein Q9160_009223 [Pyrenula sp. 1 TL-2023]